MQNIVTLTLNPAIDKSASIDHLIPEKKLRCTPPKFEPGGGGINVSRAIKKLGGTSTALYLAGGPAGMILKDLLKEEGVHQNMISCSAWTRENVIIFEKNTTLQYRFGMPGPLIQPDEWNRVLEFLASLNPGPDYIVASGSIPPGVPDDIYARVAGVAKKLKSRLIVDTSGAALLGTLKEQVFLLKPNLAELATLEGKTILDETHLEGAAMKLIQRGCCEVVVVSLGAGGALVAIADGCFRITAPTVAIQSKVGAGDSMVAGLVYALSQGHTIRDASRFGIATGTAAVMTPGTQLCRREDAERIYKYLQEHALN